MESSEEKLHLMLMRARVNFTIFKLGKRSKRVIEETPNRGRKKKKRRNSVKENKIA